MSGRLDWRPFIKPTARHIQWVCRGRWGNHERGAFQNVIACFLQEKQKVVGDCLEWVEMNNHNVETWIYLTVVLLFQDFPR